MTVESHQEAQSFQSDQGSRLNSLGSVLLTAPSSRSIFSSIDAKNQRKGNALLASAAFEQAQESPAQADTTKGGTEVLVRMMRQIAEIMRKDASDPAKQERDLQELLSKEESAHGKKSKEVSQLLNFIGRAFEGEGEYARAEKYYKQGVDAAKTAFGENSFITGLAIQNVAHMENLQGHYDKAVPYYQQALRIYEANHPESDVAIASETIDTLKDYAQVLDALGRHDEAKKARDRIKQISSHYNRTPGQAA
jgi:tetratricopeptide (TPR) repeat protein